MEITNVARFLKFWKWHFEVSKHSKKKSYMLAMMYSTYLQNLNSNSFYSGQHKNDKFWLIWEVHKFFVFTTSYPHFCQFYKA
jgi:hypothetical protein